MQKKTQKHASPLSVYREKTTLILYYVALSFLSFGAQSYNPNVQPMPTDPSTGNRDLSIKKTRNSSRSALVK